MRFRTTVRQMGNNTGILVPESVLDELGGSKRPAVVVTVGALTYRTTVGKMAGEFLLPLSKDNRTTAGVAGGEDVDVEIDLDTAPREVSLPDELAAVLAAEPALAQRFEGLSPSSRKRLATSVESAKTPQTRQRRIDAVVAELRS